MGNGSATSGGLPQPPDPPLKPDPTIVDLTVALRIIEDFEGLRLTAYRDPVGVWTIGYGTTNGVTPGETITKEEASNLLLAEVTRLYQFIKKIVTVPLTNNQLCALISFAYNVGESALEHSTLLRFLNQSDYKGAADQLLRWDHAGGQILPGLTRRRTAERLLFLS